MSTALYAITLIKVYFQDTGVDTSVQTNPSRRDNRQSLIDATIASIVEIGLIRTSVSEIIARAGVSRGMIHLHFQGKENLIVAAAEAAADDYYDTLKAHLVKARPEGQFQIEAMILCDLGPTGLTEEKTRIWHELRGAVRAYPALHIFSDTRDRFLQNMTVDSFSDIFRQTGCPEGAEQARDMSIAILTMMEGMWSDFMLHPENFDRARAAQIVFRVLASVLPGYFDLNGARDYTR